MSKLLPLLALLVAGCSHEPMTWVGPRGEPFDLAVYESALERATERRRVTYNIALDEAIRIEMNNIGWRRAPLPEIPAPPTGYVWRLVVPGETP